MPYVPPSATAVGLAFTSGYAKPPAGSINIEFDTRLGDIYAGAGSFGAYGTPRLIQSRFILARGKEDSVFGFVEVDRTDPKIAPLGIDNTIVVGTPAYVSWRRYLGPYSIDEPGWPLGDGRVRLLGGYNPPPAINVILNWDSETYSVPPASNVILEFSAEGSGRILGATLFSQLTFGAHTVSQPLGFRPSGIASTAVFGTHSVSLSIAGLRPSGWMSSLIGSHTLTLTAAGIFVGGIAPPPQTGPNGDRIVPDPTIDFRVRYALPASLVTPVFPLTHYVARYYQYIDLAGQAFDSLRIGSPTAIHSPRYVEPYFISSAIFGTPSLGRFRILLPETWESSYVPVTHGVANTRQLLFPTSGGSNVGYGTATVENFFKEVAPEPWISSIVNFPIIYNLRQRVFVGAYRGDVADPTAWPGYSPLVENVNRTIVTSSWLSSRFGIPGHSVTLTARNLALTGIFSPVWGPETFISHQNRTVYAEGWNILAFPGTAIVYNDARVLAPSGWKSDAFGTPNPVLNLNRTVIQTASYETDFFGTAFVAYRIRYVSPGTSYDNVPYLPTPKVRYDPNLISVLGIEPPLFGVLVVERHVNLVRVGSIEGPPLVRTGIPAIANRNRVIGVAPTATQTTYGTSGKIELYKRFLLAEGMQHTLWGPVDISYRTKVLRPVSISRPVFTVLHRIKNDIPDPPGQQNILPPSVFIGGNPNELYAGIIPNPVIRFPTFYPSGIYEGGFGPVKVAHNGIKPGSIFSLDQVGIPSCSGTQYVYPRVVPWPNDRYPLFPEGSSDQNKTRARLSPHTIYAPSSDQATPQAVTNNGDRGHLIDGRYPQSVTSQDYGWPWFGYLAVSNKNRSIGPIPNHSSDADKLSPSSRFGGAALTFGTHYIFPTPIRGPRFGWVVIFGVTQYVTLDELNNGIPPFNVFGSTAVGYPPNLGPRTVAPSGLSATSWGAHRIELFNREVLPVGIVHRGNPQQGLTSPWGIPAFTHYIPPVVGGYVFTLWGTTWVSHKNRSFQFQGFDSCSLQDEDLGSFADRMRVTQRNAPGAIPSIGPSAVFGTPEVAHYTRTIYARSIVGLKLGDCTVKGRSTLVPVGWDSSVFGDIDRWEAGVIKPYGPDMSLYGTPRMGRGVDASGWISSLLGTPRFGTPIYVSGMPPIGFEGPSVSNPFGCNNRVVTPLPVLATQIVASPNIRGPRVVVLQSILPGEFPNHNIIGPRLIGPPTGINTSVVTQPYIGEPGSIYLPPLDGS